MAGWPTFTVSVCRIGNNRCRDASAVSSLGIFKGNALNEFHYQGHHSCGRQRHAPSPDDHRSIEAIAPDLRQAPDLLSAFNADDVGHPGYLDYFDSSRLAKVPAFAGRRIEMGDVVQLRRATEPGWVGPSLHHRR